MVLGPASPGRALSKKQLQRELDLPRARGCVGDLPCRRAETGARENDLVRDREIGVVERIEGLDAQIEPQPIAPGNPSSSAIPCGWRN